MAIISKEDAGIGGVLVKRVIKCGSDGVFSTEIPKDIAVALQISTTLKAKTKQELLSLMSLHH